MRISFDLDDTLICYGGGVECEPGLSWLARILVGDEPLRKGTPALARELHRRGHEVWIYTTSNRKAGWIRRWLKVHGVHIDGIVNGERHNKQFGEGSAPTKRPKAFEIGLHVDNSQGVDIEGKIYGFEVCVVERDVKDWERLVLAAVERVEKNQGVTQAARPQEDIYRALSPPAVPATSGMISVQETLSFT